ncbi:hypothetical protein [Pararhodobacter zhoushanensis]|nr:hypothetical protein [Pararhodobacter zhoushanensis]
MTKPNDLQTILADPAALKRWISWCVALRARRDRNAARVVFCSSRKAAQ